MDSSAPSEDGASASRPGDVTGDEYLHRVIAERYQIESHLGQGSMGTVYRCRHRVLGNPFAVKIIRRELSRDAEAVDRFFTEARAASAIGSRHIVEVIDFGELPNGAAYILMEYLEGRTLYRELEQRGRLPAARALDIAIQLAEGIAAAHAAGIVHRDLKPDNVFLLRADATDATDATGSRAFVKILDFGVAKVLRAGSKLTQAGTVLGTPAYMSPEQAMGAATDHRTDVYALGVMLYEMACGEIPFDADNPVAVISKQISEAPRSLSDRLPPGSLPAGYEAVVAKCLAKHPDDRFQSMNELKAALQALAAGLVPELAPPRHPTRRSITPFAYGVPAPILDGDDNDDIPFLPKRRAMVLRLAGGLALGAAAALGFIVATSSDPNASTAPSATAAATAAPAAAANAPAPAVELREVHVILHPIDARAHDGSKDLGMMPITVKLAPGEKKVLTITRRGYVTRKVTLDGSTNRVVAGLVLDRNQSRQAPDNPY